VDEKCRKRARHGTDVRRGDAGGALREAPDYHVGGGLTGAQVGGQRCRARWRSADGDVEDGKRWSFPN
jgi:hypothetical protein